ncbi:platelet-activating factor acetylhydrolase [Neohortaea acidophila]|uniref:Putative phospholipase n=1 Tax=Neohortaea acidophila TaxID=245834 RepID=A0A6A6PUG0_9PEZI|nr:platelet-activating factor acetylhydrolase [Neohortaea acidophila]KAF2483720.1 platelet-activating factor acetylhydrolase [Neohortaea acidophila]
MVPSVINSFPDYHGRYEVGTVDVEIPAANLPAPSASPENAPPTVAFRIFYPCVQPASGDANRPVRWISQPQRLTLAALMKFLGMKERMAGLASYLPQHFYYINLRAHRNAKLLEAPTSNGRWPVTFFSHGLAGSRNAYSYICGDLASHGMIVIAMDHRDGSSPVQYVRATTDTPAHVINAVKISHEPCEEVWQARDRQLRIRLWEISMAYEALMQIDAGQAVENLDCNTSNKRQERVEVLWQFDGKLDIHRAGKVSWAGHSFGAATMTQLVKSIYYSAERPAESGKPLIKPNPDAAVLHQIMPESPLLILDMWGLPLQSPDQAFLWDRPLPAYTTGDPQAVNVLSVLSEGFFNWKDNTNINKHIVSGDTGRAQEAAPSTGPKESSGSRMFYVQRSQHFNHSDFGILFPFLARRFTKAEEPEWILELNTRAMVQAMREAGIEMVGTDDRDILSPTSHIRKWIAIPSDEGNDRDRVSGESALNLLDRKLSLHSMHDTAEPTDRTSSGEQVQGQLEI